jgi:hypothetical protein
MSFVAPWIQPALPIVCKADLNMEPSGPSNDISRQVGLNCALSGSTYSFVSAILFGGIYA